MRHLPPLNALRVFEVAARTGSYAEAAAELGLTHGAVSRQIGALERWLGQRLFVKAGRRMHLLLASETRPGDWTDWLEAAGVSHLAGHDRQVFDHFFVTRQAVEDGIGIGIGPMPMLDIDIAAGRLMTPLPGIRVRRTGYVALIPRHFDNAALPATFVDWLAAEGFSRTACRPLRPDIP